MRIFLSKEAAKKLEGDLCVKLGFCSMREKYDEIVDGLPKDLTEIVNAIFVAEGLDPGNADRRLWRQVRELVTKAHHDSFDEVQQDS